MLTVVGIVLGVVVGLAALTVSIYTIGLAKRIERGRMAVPPPRPIPPPPPPEGDVELYAKHNPPTVRLPKDFLHPTVQPTPNVRKPFVPPYGASRPKPHRAVSSDRTVPE